MPLFEYAILSKDADGNEYLVDDSILAVVAADKASAERIAVRAIPDGVDVAAAVVIVRPFV